jgi:hypothetical protein
MKKLLLSTAASLFYLGFATAQTATQLIEINNVKALITNTGPLFLMGTKPFLIFPKPETKALFSLHRHGLEECTTVSYT